jgi:methylmalonyl-CoA/ethylmalonyl-CoA epimerase
MTEQPPDLFTAIDHVGVAVNDLDVAIAFYRDAYGMTRGSAKR